ncbi:unnamed protein product [Nezara viridula]|uniref:Serine protease K12H4.7 n=1 Tax=Nezara viridula TaxID=85310 RepID=A0A9P0ECV1_NEZVI|nr:unnamed protein product [Nezara viridula]
MKIYVTLSFLLFFTLSVCCQKRKFGIGTPKIPKHVTKLPEEQWFDQKIDHFRPTDLRTWKQRYFVNDTFFNGSSSSPIFLMIGGEGEASAKWMVAGAWIEFAEKLGALCFQLEHRFYGKSRPLPNKSVESLEYLNSEQALGDLAEFIGSMNRKYNLQPENKWIAFGGSYPGSLAAWVRYKFPHLVHASISSSGPLLAKADFKEYNEVVKDSLSYFNKDCVSPVRLANKHLTKLFQDPSGGTILTKMFRLCAPLDIENINDVYNLAQTLSDNFAGIVQYNKDNRITDSPTAKITIDDICKIMTSSRVDTPLESYAAVNSMMLNLTNQTCLDYKYDEMLDVMRKTEWSEDPTDAGRQWIYQTCVEFGFYQTSSTSGELFGPNFPFEFFLKQCSDIYGRRFDYNLLEHAINRTNNMYGELKIRATRVMFVHGSIDPWHALGITESKNPSTPTIFIKGTAHCADMYPSADTDIPQLKEARKEIFSQIKKWLNDI